MSLGKLNCDLVVQGEESVVVLLVQRELCVITKNSNQSINKRASVALNTTTRSPVSEFFLSLSSSLIRIWKTSENLSPSLIALAPNSSCEKKKPKQPRQHVKQNFPIQRIILKKMLAQVPGSFGSRGWSPCAAGSSAARPLCHPSRHQKGLRSLPQRAWAR